MNDSNPQASLSNPPAPRERLLRWTRKYRGSLLFVALPTLVAALYYGLIAADLYASEASFIVRSPSHAQMPSLAGLLQGSAISRAQDEVFAVHDFIMSRDAIAAVRKHFDLHAAFGYSRGDIFSTWPNPVYPGTDEDFFRYYHTRVAVAFDSTTGMTSLTVKAFRAQDAKQIAELLLEESEALVNRLNQRAHDNAVRDAETEVQLAESRIADAQQQTLAYRNQEALLDPGKSSGAIFESLSKMQAELTATRIRLAELDRTSPGSPARSGLEAHVTALSQQVEQERARLAGSGSSMAPKISQYERLMLQQDFAAKELAAAMGALESAREEARRQQIYLERVVEPNLPDKALFPKRILSVLIVLITCFLGYSTLRLLVAGLREHSQV